MHVERYSGDFIHAYLVWDGNHSRVISRAVVLEKDGSVELRTIDVDKMYHGSGIGTKLLRRIIANFSGREIIAWVFDARVNWYVRNGFKVSESNNNMTKMCRAVS
jgi:N-acetylglutamate synthase-like GNAT family acetyltransferase